MCNLQWGKRARALGTRQARVYTSNMVNLFRGSQMSKRITLLSTAAMATIAMGLFAVSPAEAKCTRLGFSVNDYGKEGPTNDAKNLLDKHIKDWATQQGIANYRTGKKDVKCELFLDVILFDEYTCRAEADVCWDG